MKALLPTFPALKTTNLIGKMLTRKSSNYTQTPPERNLIIPVCVIEIFPPTRCHSVSFITTFLEESYGIKYPVGYVGCLAGATTAANVASAALAGEFCFGLITQQLTVGAEELSLLCSAAYYTGVIASMQVGNTMTMKEVPGVTAVSPELSFETGGDGKALLEAGITTFKVQDRGARRVIVVNSEQPNGLDLYINRVRNYIVKEFALHEFLGERNNDVTINEIKHEVDRVRYECVNVLNLPVQFNI